MFDFTGQKYEMINAAITTAAIGVAAAGYQVYNAEEQKKEAKRALNKHKPQDLANNHEEIRISTAGTDLKREESGRNAASYVEAAREGGIRGVMSTVPKIQSNLNDVNREIAVSLDDQIIKRDYAAAGESERIRGIKEGRDEAKLAGLGTALNVANHDSYNGIRGIANSVSYGLRSVDSNRANSTNEIINVDNKTDQIAEDSVTDASLASSNYEEYLKQQKELEMRREAFPKYGL